MGDALVEDRVGARGDGRAQRAHDLAREVDDEAGDLRGADGHADGDPAVRIVAPRARAAAAGGGALAVGDDGARGLERLEVGGDGGQAQAEARGDVLAREGLAGVQQMHDGGARVGARVRMRVGVRVRGGVGVAHGRHCTDWRHLWKTNYRKWGANAKLL
ncbi:MAG: hypothetical protein UHD09_09470 [Bifidobacterium sp.]|nr:hypothetical protein [Bifidobacterium sp.]